MKRIYIAPKFEIVKLNAESMLAGSDPDNVTGTVSDTPVTTGWADARGNDGTNGDQWED